MPSNQNSSHIMYDYISLEGDLTAVLSTNNFDKTGSSFRVFPNPAMESIHVKVDHENITKLTISVLNLLGEKIIKTSPEKSISNIYSIDIKNKLTSGIYMIKVDTETASYVSKIVVK